MDDDLNLNNNGNGEGGGDGDGKPAAQPTGGISAEDLATALGPISDALGAVNNRLGAVEQGIQTPQNGAGEAGEPSKDDLDALAAQLLTDPKATIESLAKPLVDAEMENTQKGLREGLAPILSDFRDDKLDEKRTEFDDVFGAGFFDKEVRPKLLSDDGKSGILDNYGLGMQARADVIKASIDAVIGGKASNTEGFQELLDLKSKAVKERETMNPGGDLGNGLPRARQTRLDPELSGQIEEILSNQRNGVSLTKEDLTNAPVGNIEEFRAAKAAKAKAAGAK